MKPSFVRIVTLFSLTLLLSACFLKKTPQETAEAFWEAVLEGDAQAAVDYSTLTDVNAYDAFAKDWTGYEPNWGKVVIEGDRARVDARFVDPNSDDTEGRKVSTYLVMKDDTWKVDYARTKMEIQGGVFGKLFGKLNEIGDDLAEEFSASKEELNSEMERMSRELEAFSDEVSREASESLEKIAEDLQKSLDEMAESIKRSLEDDENMSDQDRRQLNKVVDDLEQSSERLDDPSVESISEGSKSMARAQREVIVIDEEEMEQYKQQWREMEQKMEAEIQKFLDEFASPSDDEPNQTRI